MCHKGIAPVLLVLCGLFGQAQGQDHPASTSSFGSPPLYQVSFERSDAVAGLDASPAIKLPFECTNDGTIFMSMVPLGGEMHPPTYAPLPLLLVSVSPSNRVHTFPLDQATEQLYDVREVAHYAAESRVIFLIKAASENQPVKQTYTKPDGMEADITKNAAERHLYIVVFDREGRYIKTIQIDVPIEVQQIGMFSTGVFLAFGYSEKDHSPKLVMLKDDGTLMRSLQIGKDDAPGSMLRTKDEGGQGPAVYVAPTQFVPHGHSIVLVQTKSTFPPLEISEGGEIRAIHPKLPKGTQIEGVIESDEDLFARINPVTDASVYELDLHDGGVLSRFELSDGRLSSSVACVHDGKFLSFEHGEGKLIPLVGVPELSTDASHIGRQTPPTSKSDK
jgi:hypothetical protein